MEPGEAGRNAEEGRPRPSLGSAPARRVGTPRYGTRTPERARSSTLSLSETASTLLDFRLTSSWVAHLLSDGANQRTR